MASHLPAMNLASHVQGVTLEFLSGNCPNCQCRLLNISRRRFCLNLAFFRHIRGKATVSFVMDFHGFS